MKSSLMQAGARPAARESATIAESSRLARSDSDNDAEVAEVSGYRVGRLLSRTSRTLVCEATRGGHRYALKLARIETGAEGRARLAEEFRVAFGLSHGHIATPVAWLDEPPVGGIVFPYYSGGDLVSLAGAEPCHWALALRDVARALGYLHHRGLAHRDVKARNVLFDAAGRAVLIDFGSCEPLGADWHAGGTTAEHRRPGRPRSVEASDDLFAYAKLVREMLGPRFGTGRPQSSRRRLSRLITETLSSSTKGPCTKLDAFEAVLELVSREESSPG